MLCEAYVSRAEQRIGAMCDNILAMDRAQPPRPDRSGRLTSQAAADLFGLLADQVGRGLGPGPPSKPHFVC